MKRLVCLGILTLTSLFTMVTCGTREETVDLAVHDLGNNLYMLANGSGVQGMGGGGNTAIFVTNDGVVLVDTKIQGYGKDILSHVRGITDKPVTTIINTHTHYDHSGSNTEFPDTVEFIAHENTRKHLASRNCDDGEGFEGGSIKNCDAFQGASMKYLPKTTFSDKMTLFSGPDQIDLYYFGRGHTDGDTWIVFRAARAMHTGDMFARKGLPYLDVAYGNGSALQFGETLRKALAGISNVDTVIPGHNALPLVWDDLVDYSGFYNDIVEKAKTGKATGQSADEVSESYAVPSEFSDFVAEQSRLRLVVQYLFDGV